MFALNIRTPSRLISCHSAEEETQEQEPEPPHNICAPPWHIPPPAVLISRRKGAELDHQYN